MNATTLADEFEDLCLVDLFNPNLHVYPDKPEIIKLSKNINAVLYQGFYLNHLRLQCNINVVKKLMVKNAMVRLLSTIMTTQSLLNLTNIVLCFQLNVKSEKLD
jgi:hypothetical protein